MPDIAQPLRPLEKSPHGHKIFVQRLGCLFLLLPPQFKRFGADILKIFPAALLKQGIDIVLNGLKVTPDTAIRRQLLEIKAKMFVM
jgi:hypothetical protein